MANDCLATHGEIIAHPLPILTALFPPYTRLWIPSRILGPILRPLTGVLKCANMEAYYYAIRVREVDRC